MVRGCQCFEGPWACLPTVPSLPGRWEPGRTWRRHCWAVRGVEAEGTVPSLSPKGVDTEACHQERGRRPGNGDHRGLCCRTETGGVWSPRPWEGWGTGEAGLSLPRSSWAHPIPGRAGPLPRGSQASEGLSVGVLVGGQMGPEQGGTGPPSRERSPQEPGGRCPLPAGSSGPPDPPSPPSQDPRRLLPPAPSPAFKQTPRGPQPDEEQKWTRTPLLCGIGSSAQGTPTPVPRGHRALPGDLVLTIGRGPTPHDVGLVPHAESLGGERLPDTPALPAPRPRCSGFFCKENPHEQHPLAPHPPAPGAPWMPPLFLPQTPPVPATILLPRQ